MAQFIIGIIIVVLGVIFTTVGGFVVKDGWEKMHGKDTNKKSVDIQQTATGNDNIQAATTGDNSPIIIDNSKKVIEHKIVEKVLSYNKPVGNLYLTKVELYSQHIIPNVYFVAHAESIVEFDVTPQRAGGHIVGHSGKREGYSFTNIPNFGGKYLMIIKTRKPEKISIEYELE